MAEVGLRGDRAVRREGWRERVDLRDRCWSTVHEGRAIVELCMYLSRGSISRLGFVVLNGD